MSRPSRPPAARPERNPHRTLAEVAAELGAPVPGGAGSVSVTGLTHDSRDVQPGDLYVAVPGASVHGAQFATDVAAHGAAAVLTDPAGAAQAADADLPVLVVADPRRVMGPLAAWLYGEPARALTTIGVTGTNGKTTTAYLVEAGLRAAGRRPGLIGTIETRIDGEVVPSTRTTPEATDLQALFAVMRERGVDGVVMEVSSHALAYGRVSGTTFDVAVFTNLSEDHLDYHRDLDDYFAAKARLFTGGASRRGVVDVDDEHGRRLAAQAPVPVVRVSPAGDRTADWWAEDVEVSHQGSRFVVVGRGGRRVAGSTRLPGAFNVDNAVLAVVALAEAGVDLQVAADGVASCPGVPGRMERVDAGQRYLAVVDYAHSPDALERLLQTCRELAGDRRVLVVVGCGGDRDPYKRPVMGEIAARCADVAVLTDDNPRTEDPLAILAAMRRGAGEVPDALVEVVPDRRAAIVRAVEQARPGDVVVVAGKGHEQGQEVDGVLLPFDDRVVLRAAVQANP